MRGFAQPLGLPMAYCGGALGAMPILAVHGGGAPDGGGALLR